MALKKLPIKTRINIISMLTIISALLIIANGLAIAFYESPIIVTAADPYIIRASTWEDFVHRVQGAKMVTIMYNPPSTDLKVEASIKINVSETELARDAVITFDGTFPPPGYSGPREKEDLKTWVSEQLGVDTEIIHTDRLISIERINAEDFWWRLSFGLPGLVEGGMVYAWLSLAFLLLLIGTGIHLRSARQKRYSIWIIIISLLSLPIGGGFIIGAVLGLIAGLAGIHGEQSLEQTFIGRIIRVLGISKRTLAEIVEDKTRMQNAISTILFVSVLCIFGSGLYAYNVNKIYSGTSASNLNSAYSIFIRGAVFADTDVYFGILQYISVGIIKWLLLSLILYLVISKLLRKDLAFDKIATISAFAYTPELIQVFTPILFTNEPFLSKGMSIGFLPLPMTWSLTIFLIARIWMVIILIVGVKAMLDISTSTAFGITLFAGTLYFFSTYMTLYNYIYIPGFTVKFPGSDAAMLLITSIAFLVAIFLQIFKKED